MYPSLREVCGVRVYCFFLYDDVDFLMRTKYYAIGSRILPTLVVLSENLQKQATVEGVQSTGNSRQKILSHMRVKA